MYWPILKVVRGGPVQLDLQAALNLFFRKRAAKEFCYFRLAPQPARERQVIPRPPPKTQPPRFQKIGFTAVPNIQPSACPAGRAAFFCA
jgi:hypothetical protein